MFIDPYNSRSSFSVKEPEQYVYASRTKNITIRPVSKKRDRSSLNLSKSTLEAANN